MLCTIYNKDNTIDVYYIVGEIFDSDALRIYDVVKHKIRDFDILKLLLKKYYKLQTFKNSVVILYF